MLDDYDYDSDYINSLTYIWGKVSKTISIWEVSKSWAHQTWLSGDFFWGEFGPHFPCANPGLRVHEKDLVYR